MTSASREAQEQPGEPRLVRGLGLLEATSIVVGGIIGSSIFLAPAFVAKEVGAPGAALAVWVLSGLLAACGALCYAELSSAIPETGGTYAFLKRAYGPPVAFLFGWTMFFATSAASIAAVATGVGLYAGYFLEQVMPYGTWTTRAVAVLAISLVTAVNYLGVRISGRTQNVLTALKVALIVAVAGICLTAGNGDLARLSPFVAADRSIADTLSSMGTAMLLTLFAFNGWQFSSHVAGEIRDPERNVARSILIGICVVLVVYLIVNFAFVYTLPFEKLASSSFVGADAVAVVIGSAGAGVVSAAIVVSALGANNAQVLNYPRIGFALARDGLFFHALSRVHPSRRVPATAILFQGLWASAFALSGSYVQILTYVGFVNFLFYTLAVAGVIILRFREPDLPRPFRTFGYPITPLLFLGVAGWYLGNLLATRFLLSMVGVAIMIVGIPFYLYWTRASGKTDSSAH